MKESCLNNELKVADLFAGAGGLSLGFHRAGFNTTFYNEIDKIAARTYAQNFPGAVAFICPIEDLNAKVISDRCGLQEGEIDVMVGGPPCQGFSINAPIRSGSDPRNQLFRHYVRLVLEGLRPKLIVMENVPGLVSMDKGKTLDSAISAFEKAGYRIDFRILNAAHYGVPQERWRLIIVGTRLQVDGFLLPLPKHYSLQRPNFTGGRNYTFSYAIGQPTHKELFDSKLKPPVTVGDAMEDLPQIESGGGQVETAYLTPPQNGYQRNMRKRSRKVFDHVCMGLSRINLDRMKWVKPGGSWRDIPFELLPEGLKRARRSDHTKRYGRLHEKALSGTIMTRCDPHWGSFFHYSQDRVISVREAARLQSFPDKFRFVGSKGDQYRQIGNAVPPLMAEAIAKHVKSLLWRHNNIDDPKELVYAQS